MTSSRSEIGVLMCFSVMVIIMSGGGGMWRRAINFKSYVVEIGQWGSGVCQRLTSIQFCACMEEHQIRTKLCVT